VKLNDSGKIDVLSGAYFRGFTVWHDNLFWVIILLNQWTFYLLVVMKTSIIVIKSQSKEVVVMKDKMPKVTLRLSIIGLLLISIGLYFFNQPNAMLALFAVIVLSAVYLCGMEKDHDKFMHHHKEE